MLPKASFIVRNALLGIWITAILVCIGSYLLLPDLFTADAISTFLLRFQGWIWFVYLLMSVARGFSLLPSTPLVLAGTLLFPEQPFGVLAVSMTGILLSSTMIYYFSDYLGFSDYFENHRPDLTHKIKAKLEHPLGFLFVVGWAFFPLVPTDLVCYIAGTTKMKYWKFIAAVLVGEMILCVFYIFFGGSLIKNVR